MNSINVLSIDMDYILEPCINLYNDLCKVDNEKKVWDIINDVRNIDKHLSFNEDNLRTIFNIFTKKLVGLNDKTKVMFASNHDAILYELTKERYYGMKFNIYNIDHHHDINYSKEQTKDVDMYDLTSISNWIWYLDKYLLVDNYYWIRNWNSADYQGPKLMGNFIEVQNIKQSNLEQQNIDFIFVCNSPQWFPRKYDIYFELLIDIYKNISGNEINIEKRFFCEGNQSMPYKGKTEINR